MTPDLRAEAGPLREPAQRLRDALADVLGTDPAPLQMYPTSVGLVQWHPGYRDVTIYTNHGADYVGTVTVDDHENDDLRTLLRRRGLTNDPADVEGVTVK